VTLRCIKLYLLIQQTVDIKKIQGFKQMIRSRFVQLSSSLISSKYLDLIFSQLLR
jgi:hypothetical protein